MEDSYEKEKRLYFLLLMAVFCCILFSVSAQAAGAKNKFVKASNGNVYYYNAQGKKAKGLVTVNGKKYYFASNGVQRTGWRCVKKKYYFFRKSCSKMIYNCSASPYTYHADGKNPYCPA